MSTSCECPACHKKLAVPDRALGSRGKCRSCGTVFQLPSPGEAGRATALTGAAAVGDGTLGDAQIAEGLNRTARTEPSAAGIGTDEIPLASTPSPPSQTCINCGQQFRPDQGYDEGGSFRCMSCWNLQMAAIPALPASLPPVATHVPAPVVPSHGSGQATLVPEYKAIKAAASIFMAGAYLYLILSVIALLLGLGLNEVKRELSIETRLVACVVLLVSAFFCWVISQLISAFRDIARNSWITAFPIK